MLAVLLIVLGIQLLTMGLLDEMVTRTYYKLQRNPIYAVREVFEFVPTSGDEEMQT